MELTLDFLIVSLILLIGFMVFLILTSQAINYLIVKVSESPTIILRLMFIQ